MAEIGVNYAFAVIGNTPYLSNVQNLDCTFFPARKICLSSKLFSVVVHCTRYHFVRIHRAPIKGLLPVVVCTSIQSLRWPLSSRTYSKMIEKRSRKKLRKTD